MYLPLNVRMTGTHVYTTHVEDPLWKKIQCLFQIFEADWLRGMACMTPYNIISSCRIYAKAVQPLFCLPIYGFLLTTFLDFDILKKKKCKWFILTTFPRASVLVSLPPLFRERPLPFSPFCSVLFSFFSRLEYLMFILININDKC